MRRVGLYLRVSTQEQVERGWSMEGQYLELRRFCEAHADWQVVRVLKDPGYTAANLERPGIRQLLRLAEAGDPDVVVAWRYDRLSRDNLDFPLILSLLRKHDVDVVSATEPSEGRDDPTGGESQGGGARIVDWDGDGSLDLVFGVIDNPAGENTYRFIVGTTLSSAGDVTGGWSQVWGYEQVPGQEDQGGGFGVGDVDRDGRLDMMFAAVDNPVGADSVRFRVRCGI